MPELPEVETIRRILEGACLNKTIDRVELLRPKNVITNHDDFLSLLPGKRILNLGRKGKFLLFFLEGDLVMLSHLRMEGKWFEDDSGNLKKHDICRFYFKEGGSLIYNDVRRFGILGLYAKDSYLSESPLKNLGKEPWDLSAEELHEGLSKKKEPIKQGLLDQSLIAGLGNIYDDEALFACHIHPKTPCSLITLEQCADIKRNAERILENAISLGGSTIKSYHPKEGMDGRMQLQLKAYGRRNLPCPECGTLMHKITVGGRGTTYCPHCQRRNDFPFVLLITGPIHSGKSEALAYFKEKGYATFSCDKIIHSLYGRNDVIEGIRDIVGKKAISKGQLDRAYVAKRLAESEQLDAKVKGLLYPLLKEELIKELSKLGGGKACIEVPLLSGSSLEDLGDYVIMLESSEAERGERLEKEGKDKDAYLALNAHYPYSKNKALASLVIANDGTLEELRGKLDSIKGL